MKLCMTNIPVSGERPTLPELLKLKIPLRVRDKYESFGVFLLNDATGDKVAVIEHDCGGKAEKITTAILKEWLKGGGMNVTWESLVEALSQCEQLTWLANEIKMATERL